MSCSAIVVVVVVVVGRRDGAGGRQSGVVSPTVFCSSFCSSEGRNLSSWRRNDARSVCRGGMSRLNVKDVAADIALCVSHSCDSRDVVMRE